MTDTAKLRALRDRVQALTGPDREVDGLIEAAFTTGVYGDVVPGKGGVTVYRTAGPHASGTGRFEIAKHSTASIDAALAVAARVLGPQHDWTVSGLSLAGGGVMFDARIYMANDLYRARERPTAPLAILLALLSALIEREERE